MAQESINFSKIQRAHYKKQAVTCGHCGHTDWKYPHKLMRPHLTAFLKLAEEVSRRHRPVTRLEAGVSQNGSEYGNFAALAWWDLIEKVDGRWNVTPKGWNFLVGSIRVPVCVWTLRGEVVGQSFETTAISDVVKGETWQKLDYVRRRVPHIPQLALVA